MLEAQGLAVRYGSLEAVRDVSFSVAPGEIIALIGSNGAGKSTTLKAIMGMLPLVRGNMRWRGDDLASRRGDERVRLGLALSPEGRRLFTRMTVDENLLVGAHSQSSSVARKNSLEKVYALFPRVLERRKQLAGSLSGGEQQMVAIGRAMMSEPELLLLDEPSLGLAPKIMAEIAQAIQRINREEKRSVVLVEQNAKLALRLAHRGYVLEQGRITRSGTGPELLADPAVQTAYLGM